MSPLVLVATLSNQMSDATLLCMLITYAQKSLIILNESELRTDLVYLKILHKEYTQSGIKRSSVSKS